MKIVKRTKQYFYVELGDNDLEDVFSSSDLIRVERIDRYHTKVVYDLDFSDLQLLGRAVGNINRIKKCEE